MVIKGLDAEHGTLADYVGGTVLSDGTVAMILDTAALAVKAKVANDTVTDDIWEEPEQQSIIMVVDDSITVRKCK